MYFKIIAKKKQFYQKNLKYFFQRNLEKKIMINTFNKF